MSNQNQSILATLTDDQQRQLIAWLDLYTTREFLEKVAAPPPEGFGIHTHKTTLDRFYARHRDRAVPELSNLAAEFMAVSAHTADFDQATGAALRQIAFELARQPRGGARHFAALSRWILKLRDQEHQARALALEQESIAITRERLALDGKKFEFNAARSVLFNIPIDKLPK